MVGFYPQHFLFLPLSFSNSEEQGSLECCSSWGPRELDTTWRLNSSFSLLGYECECKWLKPEEDQVTEDNGGWE